MPRRVELRITGDTVQKSRSRAGVQGEGNVTDLVCIFDESWDGFTKTLTFWDAEIANPVQITLPEELPSQREYVTKIPAEPLEKPGKCTITIDGYVEGTRARTVAVNLTVEPSPMTERAGRPMDPVPSEVEYLLTAANAAAIRAEAAVSQAEEAASQAANALGRVEEEVTDATENTVAKAEKAAGRAEDAAREIENMTATGSFVSADSDEPYVEKSVDGEGKVNLHFNIRSGVYVGNGEMPDDCNVQVDPIGDILTPEDLMGGHYTPVVNQETEDSMVISFFPSKEGMPEVQPMTILLPEGPVYELTEEDKAEIVAATLAALPKWEGGVY